MSSQSGAAQSLVETLAGKHPDVWRASACGLTPTQEPIPVLIHRDAYNPESPLPSLLVVSGLSGQPEDTALASAALEYFSQPSGGAGGKTAVSAIPNANPRSFANFDSGFPPEDGFYFDPEAPEKRYLWRHVCWQAPDLVLEIRAGSGITWEANEAAAPSFGNLTGVSAVGGNDSLISALGQGTPDGLGVIPALRLTCPPSEVGKNLSDLLNCPIFSATPSRTKSPAGISKAGRASRPHLAVASVLAQEYGYQLDPVNYTQGVGINGRLVLHRLDPSAESPVSGIVGLVEDYVSGDKTMFPQEPGGGNLAGLIWAEELYQATGDERYRQLVIDAAERYRPVGQGQAPKPCDPTFRTEDMFMAGAMLGRAYSITEESRYIDLLVQFLLDGNIQQDSGLFWHCRTAPFFWGRGNGFAALGLTETLTYLPANHSGRAEIEDKCKRLLDGVLALQHPSGTFSQLLDVPGSYLELTCTCMFGIALSRGLRLGWLGESYTSALDSAWRGVAERVDDSAHVVDGCISTGVQTNVQEYLDRKAIFGRDDRTGGMALWFALEMEQYSRTR